MAYQNATSPDVGTVLGVMTATTALVNKKLDELLESVQSPSQPDHDTEELLRDLRKKLIQLYANDDEGLEKIRQILDKDLHGEVVDHFQKEIANHMTEQIDKLVEQQVNQELKKYAPMQDKIISQEKELNAIEWQLHNSESRRANSMIKNRYQFKEPLHTIHNDEGQVFPGFPKTLDNLFSFNDKQVKELVQHYGRVKPSESKIENLNWFMLHCGVAHQYVNPRK